MAGKEITGEMRERILHNQGCAYSYLFQMDKALDCFWKAWKENHSEKALKVYLLAYRSVHSEEEYRKRQEDLKTDEMVRQETDQALEKLCRSPGAAYRIRRNRQDPGGSHKRISQKYRLLKLFKKSQQDLRASFFVYTDSSSDREQR